MNNQEKSENSRRKCSDIMTKNVQTATADTTLREVATMMRDGDMGSVPVVEDGRLVGIVTDRDIVVRALAEGKDGSGSVSDAMTTDIVTASPDDYVFEAVRLMGDKQVRRIPVVDNERKLVGIIALADIALETEDDRDLAEALEEISSGNSFWQRA
jgi:CBS domain-containing protein